MKRVVLDITHVKSDGGKVINDVVVDTLSNFEPIIIGKRKFSNFIIAEFYRVIELLILYLRFGECLVLSLSSSVSIGSLFHDNLVYFHNVLFYKVYIKNLYQRFVIKFLKKLEFIVQTNVTYELLKGAIGHSAHIIPLFHVMATKVDAKAKIIYHISSSSIHKQNHFLGDIIKEGLLKDYVIYSTEDFKNEENLVKSFNRIVAYNREELFTMLGKGGILINTSSQESFCLPIVEAASLGLRIISFDAPYARCLLNGGAFFSNSEELKSIIENIDSLDGSKLTIKSENTKLKNLIEKKMNYV